MRVALSLAGCLSFALHLALFRTTEACPICEGGDEALNRSAVIEPIQGYEFITNCGTLQELASLAISPSSETCTELRKAASNICGCPTRMDDGVVPCRLCPASNGGRGIVNASASVYLDTTALELYAPGLSSLVQQFTPTCQLLDAYLQSIPSNADQCTNLVLESSTLIDARCKCCGNDITGGEDDDRCRDSQPVVSAPVEYCRVCRNENDTYREPGRDVTRFMNELGIGALFTNNNNNNNNNNNGTITCEMVFNTMSGLPVDHAFCERVLQELLWGYCDCPYYDNSPTMSCLEKYGCPADEIKTDLELDFLSDLYYIGSGVDAVEEQEIGSLTCEEGMWLMHGYSEDSFDCFGIRQIAYVCGCGVRNYAGATTRLRQALLAWIPRFSALLSFIGSSLIVRDVYLKRKSKRRSSSNRYILTMLQQLVCGMSCFDLCSDVGFMFSTLPVPSTLPLIALPSGVYGAFGNDATCKAQGFFIQLGVTAAFYNMMLSIYYFLVIRKGLQESQLQQFRILFHVPVLLMGFGLAFAGIPFYESFLEFYCSLRPEIDYLAAPEFEQYVAGKPTEGRDTAAFTNFAERVYPSGTSYHVWIFLLVPFMVVFSVGMSSMMLVYLHVRKQDRAANRWRIDVHLSQTSDMDGSIADRIRTSLSRAFSARSSNVRSSNANMDASSRRNQPRRQQHSLSSAVFWQFVLYTLSFLSTWPIFFVANLMAAQLYFNNYFFWVATLALFPLQGFWNSLVYFRPRIVEYFRKLQNERSSRRKSSTFNSMTNNPPEVTRKTSGTLDGSKKDNFTGKDPLPAMAVLESNPGTLKQNVEEGGPTESDPSMAVGIVGLTLGRWNSRTGALERIEESRYALKQNVEEGGPIDNDPSLAIGIVEPASSALEHSEELSTGSCYSIENDPSIPIGTVAPTSSALEHSEEERDFSKIIKYYDEFEHSEESIDDDDDEVDQNEGRVVERGTE